jgi:hypothetical protein
MTGELFINNKDAYTNWGIILGETSFTALLTPAPIKNYIQNKSALIPGKQVLTEVPPKIDERDVQLVFYLKASNLNQFLTRYSSFVTELEQGAINIKTKYQPNVVYHCIYLSCAQFSQFNGRLGKFVLKLNEPNPKNRT